MIQLYHTVPHTTISHVYNLFRSAHGESLSLSLSLIIFPSEELGIISSAMLVPGKRCPIELHP